MITLHKFNAAWGLPDISPFCIKVETYLRMVGLPFQTAITDSRKAPKRKLPFISEGELRIDDSRDIIDHFEGKLAPPLDAGLSERERAISVAFRGLVEAEMYFYAVHLRWQCEDAWQAYRPVLLEYVRSLGVPSFLAPLALRASRKQVLRDLWGQGGGRYERAQVDARLCAAMSAVSTQLGDGPYFLGEKPRTIDATVHAFSWALLDPPFESASRAHAHRLGNLSAYCSRMRESFFAQAPDRQPQPSGARQWVGSPA